MKKLIIIGIFLYSAQLLFCQTSGSGNWMVNANVGIEEQDKRLFNYSERETLLEMQPEFWGTYHLGLQVQRKFLQKQKFAGYFGVGINFEKATFDRPFDHLYFKKDSFYILRHQNDYEKYISLISLRFQYSISANWHLSGQLNSQFLMHRSLGRSEYSETTPYKESVFEVEGVECNIGINYVFKHLWFGLNSRVLNYQKIDKIIFNYLISDPRIDQKWEWNNPLRFDFIIGYTW